jgi:hypothetical protein
LSFSEINESPHGQFVDEPPSVAKEGTMFFRALGWAKVCGRWRHVTNPLRRKHQPPANN